MTMKDQFIKKFGYGVNPDCPRMVNVADVMAVIEMAKEGKTPDGSFGDDLCDIWQAVTRLK